MMKSLPLSFMQGFKPERRFISLLLKFTQSNGRGDKHKISTETRIPTGKSTGKVEPTINYAVGMGLINAKKDAKEWILTLTLFGELVLKKDEYLSDNVTLWLMHLMLCRAVNQSDFVTLSEGVVDPWFTLFALSEIRLGRKFTLSDYGTFMEERFGANTSRINMCKVILGSYAEDGCFGLIKAIEFNSSGQYMRNQAPLEVELYPVYSAYLFLLWDEFYPNEKQLSLNDIFQRTRMLSVMCWNNQCAKPWLDWMVDNGLLQLDRQTGETLALRTVNTIDVIDNIYSELI